MLAEALKLFISGSRSYLKRQDKNLSRFCGQHKIGGRKGEEASKANQRSQKSAGNSATRKNHEAALHELLSFKKKPTVVFTVGVGGTDSFLACFCCNTYARY